MAYVNLFDHEKFGTHWLCQLPGYEEFQHFIDFSKQPELFYQNIENDILSRIRHGRYWIERFGGSSQKIPNRINEFKHLVMVII